MSYKLSYTAQEVDELLGKVKGGVCLPVVELSTEPTAEGAELTAEESAKMDAAAENDAPLVVKFIFDGVRIAATVTKLMVDDAVAYSARLLLIGASYNITLVNESGEWIGQIRAEG